MKNRNGTRMSVADFQAKLAQVGGTSPTRWPQRIEP